MEKITIWHTNDLHSHFERWPRLIKRLKEEKTNENTLFFDIGDFMDRMHPLTEASKGKANVALLNDLPFDAVTIGNNEGVTLAHEDLAHLYDEALFPVLCCNLYQDKECIQRPKWLVPTVYKNIAHVKIAVIGATAPFTDYYKSLGWEIVEPIQAIREQIDRLDNDTDIIILLSHLGLPTDEKLAESCPEIDVILGSHTHHLLEDGLQIGSTLLAACGRWGEYIGKVTIAFDEKINKVAHKKAETFPVSDLAPPPDEETQTKQCFKEGKTLLDQKIVTLPEKLTHNWFGPSKMADILHEASCEWTGADTFLTNAGIYMTDIGPGKVTAFDIHQLLPHPLNLIVITMTGAELSYLIQTIREKETELVHLPLRGFGFRGEYFGVILSKQMGFDKKQNQALWEGEPIDPQKIYQIATHDTFVYAPFFPLLQHHQKKEIYAPELLRDIFTWKLKEIYSEVRK